MKFAQVLGLLTIFLPLNAVAEGAVNCTKVEKGQFVAALERAERLALTATTAIGPNPVFDRWFGAHNPKSGEHVRKTMKSIVKAMRSEEINAQCRNNGEDLCDAETYAFVDKDAPYTVNLCPNFFEMDTMKQLTTQAARDGNGTRAGTLVHEISHFAIVADTDDICYSRADCTEMALSEPRRALVNADSYQYFVEDVTFFGVQGEDGRTTFDGALQ